ncbi:MAG: hypothetical protein KA020_01905 [Planctomycetes bacterium]|jgi:hypothetical protein|nr:hypothetical protein [Planctomycetota bacterium]MCC7061744.1 hypothetical protein [Planctomycetota bacterium]
MQFGLVGGCFHPETGEPVAFRFDDRYVDIRSRGPRSMIADILTIAEVAQKPERTFKGLKRDGKGDAYALLGRPKERFLLDADGDPRPVPVSDKKRFFVYVADSFCIYHHAWVDLDFEHPGLAASEAEAAYVTMCFDEEIKNVRRP